MTTQIFPANRTVCPNCGEAFENNKINGVALVAAVSDIDARKRMHARLALDSIEIHMTDLTRPEFLALKKVFLDAFNDFNRDIQTILGLDDGVE